MGKKLSEKKDLLGVLRDLSLYETVKIYVDDGANCKDCDRPLLWVEIEDLYVDKWQARCYCPDCLKESPYEGIPF